MLNKKLNIKTAKQIHGKLEPESQENYETTTLDELWGETGLARYSTNDLEEYTNSLTEMNGTDLRRHAIEVARVVPALSRERTEKRLILEFKKHVAASRVPKHSQKPEQPASKEILKIMSETK